MSEHYDPEINGPAFFGTPNDWWDNAENITEWEARNRTFGSWYISIQRTAGASNPMYRIMTPSRYPDTKQMKRDREVLGDRMSERVRLLMRTEVEEPAWMTAEIVIADTFVDGTRGRKAWVRRNSGRWVLVSDARLQMNDFQMAERNPQPARITEVGK